MAKVKVLDVNHYSKVVFDIKPKASKARNTGYYKKVQIKETLPFKLRITNIGIDGVNPLAPPGIGVQIIGFSNYII
jgi:hypothetical protein